MEDAITLRLSQEHERLATEVRGAHLGYRFAYSRAADTCKAKGRGQDYLIISDDGQRLVFALCDGVSQSFFGDLAARLLGEALVEWLWGEVLLINNPLTVQAALLDRLRDLTAIASDKVRALPIGEDVPSLVREVLEQKRSHGSESTFAAGLIDTNSGRLLLVWMGDSRIRLWGPQGERTNELGDTFHTNERWSSRQGSVGQLHVFDRPIADLQRLMVYSDGLARLDGDLPPSLNNSMLDNIIADASRVPTSDDISFLEVWQQAPFADAQAQIPQLVAGQANTSLPGKRYRTKLLLSVVTFIVALGVAASILWADSPVRSWLAPFLAVPTSSPIPTPTPTLAIILTPQIISIPVGTAQPTIAPSSQPTHTLVPQSTASATAMPTFAGTLTPIGVAATVYTLMHTPTFTPILTPTRSREDSITTSTATLPASSTALPSAIRTAVSTATSTNIPTPLTATSQPTRTPSLFRDPAP